MSNFEGKRIIAQMIAYIFRILFNKQNKQIKQEIWFLNLLRAHHQLLLMRAYFGMHTIVKIDIRGFHYFLRIQIETKIRCCISLQSWLVNNAIWFNRSRSDPKWFLIRRNLTSLPTKKFMNVEDFAENKVEDNDLVLKYMS